MLLLNTLMSSLLLFDNCSRTFISKNVIISTLWAIFTLWRLRFLIFNTKVVITEVIIFILFNFLDESHIDKVLNLFLLVVCPIVFLFQVGVLTWFNRWLRIWIFLLIFFLYLFFFKLLLVLLSVEVFKELFFVSFELILSQLFNGS